VRRTFSLDDTTHDENLRKVITAKFSRFLAILYRLRMRLETANCLRQYKRHRQRVDRLLYVYILTRLVYVATEDNISIKHFALLSYFKISFIITAYSTLVVCSFCTCSLYSPLTLFITEQ